MGRKDKPAGYGVGRGPGKYPGQAWAKRDRRGRWVEVTRQSTAWSDTGRKRSGCLAGLVLVALGTGYATAELARLAYIAVHTLYL